MIAVAPFIVFGVAANPKPNMPPEVQLSHTRRPLRVASLRRRPVVVASLSS